MINYELFKAVDDYLFENQEITDKQVKDYARSCMELETESSYSRGGRNYIELETETLGKISICAKNANLFRKRTIPILKEGLSTVYKIDDEIVGFICLTKKENNEILIISLFVSEKYRRQ